MSTASPHSSDQHTRDSSKEEGSVQLINRSELQLAQSQLCGAPMTILFLGHVSAAAGKTHDFSLVSQNATFKHLQIPTSARACILQIHQAVANAFQKAHGNMGRIGVETRNVPGLLQDILDIIADPDESPDSITNEIKSCVEGLLKICTTGIQLSKEVIDECDVPHGTMSEVILGIMAAQGIAEENLRRTQTDKENETEYQKLLTNELVEVTKEFEDTKAKRDAAEKSLNDALAEATSFATLAKQAVANGIDVLTNVGPTLITFGSLAALGKSASGLQQWVSTFSAMTTQLRSVVVDLANRGGPRHTGQASEDFAANFNAGCLIHLASQLNNAANGILKKYLHMKESSTPGGSTMQYYLDLQALQSKASCHEMISKYVQIAKTEVSTYDKPRIVVQQVLELCDGWNNIAQLLKHAAETDNRRGGQGIGDKEDRGADKDIVKSGDCHISQEIWNKRDELLAVSKELEEFYEAKGQGASSLEQGFQTMASVAANLHKQMINLINQEKRLMELHEKRSHILEERLQQYRQKLHKAEQFIRRLESEKLTQENLLIFIKDGLDCLSRMKEHWCGLQLFFSGIDTWARSIMGPAMDRFVAVHGERAMKGVTFKEGARQRLYRDACKAISTAMAIMCLTETYKGFSSDHLQPMIRVVREINTAPATAEQKTIELKRKAEDAQAAVEKILQDSRRNFETKYEESRVRAGTAWKSICNEGSK